MEARSWFRSRGRSAGRSTSIGSGFGLGCPKVCSPVIFHVVTIFPEFFRGPFEHGVIQRAREAGRIEIRVHDLRNWTKDRHRTVDDRPFGGGEGMLLKAEPLFEAVESIWPERGPQQKVVLMSAQGRKFDQQRASEFAAASELMLISGRCGGVYARLAEH